MKTISCIVLIILSLLTSCRKSSAPQGGEEVEDGVVTVTYPRSNEDFCNPERGFYRQKTLKFTGGKIPSAVSANSLRKGREEYRTLSLTLFYLTDFMEGDISPEALSVIRQSLQAHRDAGCKCVLRFAYKDGYGAQYEPYDPEVSIVLRHVEQLKPILQEYSDIILVLQAGFIGSWGEWAFTTHFVSGPESDEDYGPRRQLLTALLGALPATRQVAVRTPMFKKRIFNISLKDTITAETAFNGSDLSRVAGHNDCFISSANDVGTYDVGLDRRFWARETAYTLMGGETCTGDATYCDCEPAYVALEKYHWTYLNRDYHSGTFSLWKKNGCYDDISRRLGYRLVLEKGRFESDFKAGSGMKLRLTLHNEGFASPINPRLLEFVIVGDGGVRQRIVSSTDPRTWKADGEYTVEENFTLPEDLKPGVKYTLYMNLPDAEQSLHDKPEYSIRLANGNIWERTTGYNRLLEFTAAAED